MTLTVGDYGPPGIRPKAPQVFCYSYHDHIPILNKSGFQRITQLEDTTNRAGYVMAKSFSLFDTDVGQNEQNVTP